VGERLTKLFDEVEGQRVADLLRQVLEVGLVDFG